MTDSAYSGSRRLYHAWAASPRLQLLAIVFFTATALLGYFAPERVRQWFANWDAGTEVRSQNAIPRLDVRSVSLLERKTNRRKDVERFQVGHGDCILVAQCRDFFTIDGINAMREAVRRLEELPQVRSVVWLDRIPSLNLFGLNESPLPKRTASPRQLEAARERILANPLATGNFISADGMTLVLLINLNWLHVASDESCTNELREAAERGAATFDKVSIEFQVTGRVPLHIMMASNHLTDTLKYQLVGYSIMILSALVLFRGFSAVFLVALAPALGVFWTMGWLRFFDYQDNPFNDVIVPILISLVGLTDAVHLMSEIRNLRAAGLEPLEAGFQGTARVGKACFLTSLTTAIGFASLVTAHHEIVREFGWCCVIGVTMTFISVLSVIPLGCRSVLGRRLHVGIGKSPLDRQLTRISDAVDWVVKHDRKVSIGSILIVLALFIVCWKLEPDEKRYTGLSESGEAARALRHLDQALGGLEFAQVSVHWQTQVEERAVLQVLERMTEALRREPLIGQPLGVRELLEALPGDGPPEERMSLLDLLPPSLRTNYYHPESRYATIHFRVRDLGIARYGVVFERLQQTADEASKDFPGVQVHLQGDAIFRWEHVYRIVTDLTRSLGTASFVIFGVLTVAFRSIRLGFISVLANIFPLLTTGTILVMIGQHLEMVTVCVFTICIGIAVDDTIHFLTRYQEELPNGGPQQEVIRRAFGGVGSALCMTTIVLVAGMLTAVFGDARDARLFGIMGSATLIAALAGDLFMLPALLSRFAVPRERET
jgi:hypothetical protein